MAETSFSKSPPKADSPGAGVLGVTRDGVKILKQRPSANFTQKEALDTARQVIAARLTR